MEPRPSRKSADAVVSVVQNGFSIKFNSEKGTFFFVVQAEGEDWAVEMEEVIALVRTFFKETLPTLNEPK